MSMPGAAVDAICFGAGRFLRAVLVPAWRHVDLNVVVLQTRGDDFVKQCTLNNLRYEVDTVERDGSVSSQVVRVAGVASLGVAAQKEAFFRRIPEFTQLRFIGVGVTEAGIHPSSQAMKDLAAFLSAFVEYFPDKPLSVINTDNVAANGDTIRKIVLALTPPALQALVEAQVTFHNSMVDRITASRPTNALVPYAEPLPAKALVVEDVMRKLPASWTTIPGVHIRTQPNELAQDHLLKLGIANATHTAMVYALAVSKIPTTTAAPPAMFTYLDELFRRDLAPGLQAHGLSYGCIHQVYKDWVFRLQHKYFGMDTFFVAQNAWAKYKMRLVATVGRHFKMNPTYVPSAEFAFATACVLRFLTPVDDGFVTARGKQFKGKVDDVAATVVVGAPDKWQYATGLEANFCRGEYDFRDGERGDVPLLLRQTRVEVASMPPAEAQTATATLVRTLLQDLDGHEDGMDERWHTFADNVAVLYRRFFTDPPTPVLQVLLELVTQATTGLADEAAIIQHVAYAVENAWVVDVHTHLFPPSHESLMLWGIDALLTYHYLVAEYLMTAPVMPEMFMTWSTARQADAIWQHLFIDRSPLSEGCQGVITTLHLLGLSELVAARDLKGIRDWYAAQDKRAFVDSVFCLAKIRHVVMTNIPFDADEAQYWMDHAPYNANQFKTALRVDQVLLGDWKSLGPALDSRQLPHTLDGVRTYLTEWLAILRPVYFMASVPATFELHEDVDMVDSTSIEPNGAMLLQHVLLPLAASTHLPLALKFGALRQLNPRLGVAGDGVAVTDVSILSRLAKQNPKVKFLATFLSRVNQHEATVVANKFANVHLYGCWWYCNNPSIMQEMTRMRLELVGTGFTAQHSDARVLDQLVYKWHHFRTVLRDVLAPLYTQLHRHGWSVTARDVERDVALLLGHGYELFLHKAL
ncbi:hypothetical protein H310_04447 [Aphanomyces invadans]|uniref:Mannitol dehydrogenase N-terminal domain-containing protein n=1 Tax=Aphanomyces invadans TaxID=157072 RepID=A0A024UCY4_9STRA|nr:hypothetical protein H310_04447 [Aphanomyces invadans]ETW04070.1 hypothetical protein H310_04447 [Aphanomyces invadans]|eukprot:XP_008867026.1 hypothetical protein H310_04447 [Aphanomyces invadans]